MNQVLPSASLVSRVMVLIYGLVSYTIGVAGLGCIVAALATWIPFGFLETTSPLPLLLTNVLLVALWGVLHSVLARQSWKDRITQWIAEPAERPTYVLIAGITSLLLIGLWQPMPGVIWSVETPVLITLIWIVFAFGWVYLLASTFAINHFDLFGLRQVYLYFRLLPRPPVHFVKRFMYRFTRHPIQTGVLIGIWATPVMTVTQLVLSLGFTLYVFIGLHYEERDLEKAIGEPYVQYRQEVGMLLPRLTRRR